MPHDLMNLGPPTDLVAETAVCTAAAVAFTEGPAVDAEGSVFFSDIVNNRIMRRAPDGALSVQGAQRMRNALLHRAYGDSGLVGALAEAGDEDLKSFGGALQDAAGEMAHLRNHDLVDEQTDHDRGRAEKDVAEAIPGPSTEFFGRLAREGNLYVVLPIYEREGKAIYNTAVLLGEAAPP